MLLGPLRDLYMRFHAFWSSWGGFMLFDPTEISLWGLILFSWRLSYEISSFLPSKDFVMRRHACYIFTFWNFMPLGCYEISIWDCFLSPKRFHEIFLWDFMIWRSLWDVLLRFCAVCYINVLMRFPYEILCFLAAYFSHATVLWDFMLFCSVRFP